MESIGYRAFGYCRALQSVTIGDSVRSIGDAAFYDCTSLRSVIIGDSVTSSGNHAFMGCSSLLSIVIPESVTSIVSACVLLNLATRLKALFLKKLRDGLRAVWRFHLI